MDNLTHAHEVIDKDLPFVIDPITLTVLEQSIHGQPASLTVPQHSKNSQRLTFTIPDRYIEGHDMSEVNQAFVHFRNVGTQGQLSAGIYKVEDLAVAEDSVSLSWLIDDDATYYVGALIFSLHFICTDDAGNVVYVLPTLAYSKISVGETVWNSEEITKKYPDIIAQLEARISAIEAGGVPGGTVTPIAYLYNGVELPALPNWDKATYPYAVITLRESIGLYYLSVHKELRYYERPGLPGGDYITYFGDSTPGTALLYTWQEGMAAWELFDKDNWSISVERDDTLKDIPLWANFDLLDDAGELYVGASEPVPVYPEGGGGAAGAVLYTPQELTEEEKAQARANIGAGGEPVVIDLDTYGGGTFETSVTAVLLQLLNNGGGTQHNVPMGNLFSDLSTDRPVRVRFSLPYSDTTMAQVTVDSITTVRIDGQVFEFYLNAQYAGLGVVASTLAYITANGTIEVNLIVPGA